MKKPFKIISSIVAISAISIAWVSPTFAWGPERKTYTNDNPADHVVFNSITDNAAIGDERNFVRVREIGTEDKYGDEVKVTPGKEYEVYIGYHNNAASNLNKTGVGIANGVKVSSGYPVTLKKGERGMISGIIDTTDGDPKSVWDEAYLTTDYDSVNIRYKVGTAIIHNAGKVNGSVLSTALFTKEGTHIGINTLDGRIPGCAEYSGYITYTLVAEKTETKLKKQVSLDGENWYDTVTTKPGDIVTYKVTFDNTGNTNLANTIFKDVHDNGLDLVTGSVKIFDSNNPNGKIIDDILDISGYNVGEVASGALVQIVYQAKVSDDKDLVCKKTLNNKILLRYNSEDHGDDDANVKVECDDEKKKPGSEIDKKVSADGITWLDSISGKPGDTFDFKITFKNTGQIVQKNVFVKDVLDKNKGMEYVPGSVRIIRTAGDAIMEIEGDDSLFGDGLSIGEVQAGETVEVYYKVKFAAGKFECGTTTLYNSASVNSDIGTIVRDNVEIVIYRDKEECELPNTGPVEIVMAIVIVLGICGGGYYFYRTKKSLKTIESAAQGQSSASDNKSDKSSHSEK